MKTTRFDLIFESIMLGLNKETPTRSSVNIGIPISPIDNEDWRLVEVPTAEIWG